MSVLVTGGAGYIGSHAVLELLDAGEETVVLDDLSTGFAWAVPPAAELVVGDVGDQQLVQGIIRDRKVNAIIHFAGSIVVPESITNPLAYYANNTIKSCTLIKCAVESRVAHFIFSSSAAVYGTPVTNPVSERAAIAPISPYGTSKMMTELMLRDVSRAHDMRYVALRYFNVAGADPQGRAGQSTPAATHLIKVAAQTALGQRPYIEIFGTDYPTPDGTCIRDYIHVIDLAKAHLAALEYLRADAQSQTLNCGYGRGYSVLEVIAAVERTTKKKLEVRKGERRAGDPAALVAQAGRICEVLAWHPQVDDLDVIVAHALAWERHLMNRGDYC
jgi:UDP-glucose 4-epimerase